MLNQAEHKVREDRHARRIEELTCQAEAMPERGWKIITVREGTHKTLLEMSTQENCSIDELIQTWLTSQLTSKPRRRKEVGEVSELTSELTSQKQETTLPVTNKPKIQPETTVKLVREPREQRPYRYTLSIQPKASNGPPWRTPSRLMTRGPTRIS
jgi:adenosyl cobinamide kinase/adenosyl cobinamide phosphate guanylyltransferase